MTTIRVEFRDPRNGKLLTWTRVDAVDAEMAEEVGRDILAPPKSANCTIVYCPEVTA